MRAGATAALHPGTFSDLPGTADGSGVTAADGTARGMDDGAGGGAGVHEASKASAPDAAVSASARRAVPVFIAPA